MTDAEADRRQDDLRYAIAKIVYDNTGDPEIDMDFGDDVAEAIIRELPRLLREAGWTPPAA